MSQNGISQAENIDQVRTLDCGNALELVVVGEVPEEVRRHRVAPGLEAAVAPDD